MSRSWIGGDATVWCQDGHDPKIVSENEDGTQRCPECGREYRIEVDVEPLEDAEA